MNVIGKQAETNNLVRIDLPKLIDTRLLIQANSGGGKSYLLRKILEETHGQVQHIIIDPEGEYTTLREKYDYILVGNNRDINIDLRSAEMLATRLLELKVSAIIDLYEFKHHERIKFVKLFLDSLVNAPKKLWHPCIVAIDEAHVFAPEKRESEATGAVIDLCTRGRKRGLCAILSTQRLSKLNKDAAAETINKMMGRTSLDVDMKRVGDELGFSSKSQMFELRKLSPGEFFGFGPAISSDIMKIKVGKVNTTHIKAGSQGLGELKIPPTEKVLKVLSKLGDLPEEAGKELRTKEELKKKIRELKFELRKKPKPEADKVALQRAHDTGRIIAGREFSSQSKVLEVQIGVLKKGVQDIENKASNLLGKTKRITPPILPTKPTPHIVPHIDHQYRPPIEKELEPVEEAAYSETEKSLARCPQSILDTLAIYYPKELTRSMVALFSKYSVRSSGFINGISTLNTRNLIERIPGSMLKITEAGLQLAKTEPGALINNKEIQEFWIRKLPRSDGKILQALIEVYPEGLTKIEIAERTEYSSTSSGFINSLSRLNTLKLIEKGATIRASEELF